MAEEQVIAIIQKMGADIWYQLQKHPDKPASPKQSNEASDEAT